MSSDKGIVFKGRVCGRLDEWLFYQDEHYKLHKLKTDGSSGLKICGDTMMFVNIDSNWVYYSCVNDNRNIYKINHDGTERYKLNNDEAWWLCLAEEWLYFINHSDNRNICRINTNGQNNEALDFGSASHLSIIGDVLCFTSDREQGKSYWLQLAGGVPKKICDDQAENFLMDGDYFYYINSGEESNIFRIKKDGSCRQKISNKKAEDLKAGGELLYFVNISEGRKVYSMDIDGRILEVLTDCRAESLFVVGNKIYYSDLDHGGIIRFLDIKAGDRVSESSDTGSVSGILQGTRGYIQKSKFITEHAGELFFFDDCSSQNWKPSGSIMRLNQDGSICLKLNDINAVHPIIVDDWIYFVNLSDDYKIYKIKTDGSSLTRLSKRDIGYEPIGYADGWLYFSKDGIHRLHIESKVSSKIYDARAEDLKVSGEWVFFINPEADRKLCRVKTDGTDYSELTSEKVMSRGQLHKGWLFYKNLGHQTSIYRIRFDGSGKTDIGCGDNFNFVIEDEWIYYLDITKYEDLSIAQKFDTERKVSGSICKVKLDGNNRTLIHDCSADNLCKSGDWLYYVNYDDGAKVYKINTDGSINIRITNEKSRCLYANEEWVFYSSMDDEDKLYKIKTDGSERAVIEYDFR